MSTWENDASACRQPAFKVEDIWIENFQFMNGNIVERRDFKDARRFLDLYDANGVWMRGPGVSVKQIAVFFSVKQGKKLGQVAPTCVTKRRAACFLQKFNDITPSVFFA